MSAHLFSPLQIRDVTFRNRIAVSPMCQYSSDDGYVNDWHLVHYGSRAAGGAGHVLVEASAVQASGRISPYDLGIYRQEHVEKLLQLSSIIEQHGAVAGIQIAHAGRKASISRPWDGDHPILPEDGGWSPIYAPSAIPFDQGYQTPQALTEDEIHELVNEFGLAAERALAAGFKVVEIHAAHGYLLHEFLSPITNKRTDCYGGSFENRTRMVRETVERIRAFWPEKYPLFIRFSVTDWTEGGWDVEQTIELCRHLRPLGVDLVDCSSGALVPKAVIPVGSGFQTEFAARIRKEAEICTGAVGFITSPQQADTIIRSGQADITLLARELLRDPYWPLRAASALHQEIPAPLQYARAWIR